MSEQSVRYERALQIRDALNDVVGLMIGGSVAYNPEAVTADSDLDLIGVLDFSRADFIELYGRLNQAYEPLLVRHAEEGRINTVSIVWDEGFEIGLHLWDTSAFEAVVNMDGHNRIFRRSDFGRDFKSTDDVEVLRNLRGEERQVYKDPQNVEGGYVLKFFPCFDDGAHVYPGIQLCNLLLDPVVLNDLEFLRRGLCEFHSTLRRRLMDCYGASSAEVNLCRALPDKIQGKLSADLRQRLENYF